MPATQNPSKKHTTAYVHCEDHATDILKEAHPLYHHSPRMGWNAQDGSRV
jgi:hypothetical protein